MHVLNREKVCSFTLCFFMLALYNWYCEIPFSKLYPGMDGNNDLEEDHLTSYDIQLSIQESIEAGKNALHTER